MKPYCQQVLHHISRLEGQLSRLKNDIEQNECCESVARLSLSVAKSFDSLRAKIIEAYIQNDLLKNKPISPQTLKDLDSLYNLAKA